MFSILFSVSVLLSGSSAQDDGYEYVEVPVVTAYSSQIFERKANNKTLIGSSCEFIRLCSLSASSGCDDGSKFVVKHVGGVKRQFIIFNGSPILAFVTKKTQFANCSTFTEVTTSVKCKTVPGAENITLDSENKLFKDVVHGLLDEEWGDILDSSTEFPQLEQLEHEDEDMEIPEVETEDPTPLSRKITGNHCEYVKLCDITSTSGCTNSSKFLIRRANGTRRQFLILNGEVVLAFVTRGIKFPACPAYVSLTNSVKCKVEPSAANLTLPSLAQGSSTSEEESDVSSLSSPNDNSTVVNGSSVSDNSTAKVYPVVDFTHHAHDAFGKAQIVDSTTIDLTELFYDGAGPKTNWIVGTKSPIGIDSNTYIIDELTADGAVKYSVNDLSSSVPSLPSFDSDSFTLRLPIVGGKQLTWEDVTWVALYCRQVNMLFMDVKTQDLMNVPE